MFSFLSRLGRLDALVLAFSLVRATLAAAQEDCAYRTLPPQSLVSASAVERYAPVLRSCSRAGETAVALREMSIGGEALLLLADPAALTTRLERAACWSCRDIDDDALADTRMGRAIAQSAEAPGLTHRGFLQNAGLVHGAGAGSYVTGDLCPSHRPLDRSFIDRVAAQGPHAPLALSISGLWLTHHFADYRWLLDRQARGDSDIVWTNHSYTHPFRPGTPYERNFLLTPGVDADREILETERLLIANGQTPSLFFRFPGLISDALLMQAASRRHLISLGADAWLAQGRAPKPGAIILVHPNGNEPYGLRLFEQDLARGTLPRPFAPLTQAP